MAVLHLHIWMPVLAAWTVVLVIRLLILLIKIVVDTFANWALGSLSLVKILSGYFWTALRVLRKEELTLSCLVLLDLLMRVVTVAWV